MFKWSSRISLKPIVAVAVSFPHWRSGDITQQETDMSAKITKHVHRYNLEIEE